MTVLNVDPKIISMANSLRLDGADAVRSIMDYCKERIAKILRHAVSVRTIGDLERLICTELNLVIHEVWTDEDVAELSKRYIAEGEAVFAALDMELDADSYGVLYQRRQAHGRGPTRYIAVVDCRGEKAARRFFTRWHEIAHRLTTFQQFELPFHRTTISGIEKDPIEKLMDIIAGEVGFFDPLFRPVLETEIQASGRLSFEVAENVRIRYCPDASFQSTLNACAARLDAPVILLEAGMGLKKREFRELHDLQMALIPLPKPKACLRVLSSIPNEAARDVSLRIHKNMRVPETSIVYKVFNADSETTAAASEASETLATWTSSDGGHLPEVMVHIQAQKRNDRVLAIVAPVDNRAN